MKLKEKIIKKLDTILLINIVYISIVQLIMFIFSLIHPEESEARWGSYFRMKEYTVIAIVIIVLHIYLLFLYIKKKEKNSVISKLIGAIILISLFIPVTHIEKVSYKYDKDSFVDDLPSDVEEFDGDLNIYGFPTIPKLINDFLLNI